MSVKNLVTFLVEGNTNKQQTKIAVIIKGNPRYIANPKIKNWADSFYSEIKEILTNHGYTVEFDPGADYTRPNMKASIWIGHSRGISRLRFADKHIKTYALETKDSRQSADTQEGRDAIGMDKLHYELSANDLDVLNSL